MWEHLVCANCAGPVSEGRCRVCRASRERMNRRGLPFSPAVMVALAALVVLAALLVQRMAG